MKKILLCLGALPLAALPLIAMASCGCSTTTTPTLETEFERFNNKEFETSDSTKEAQTLVNELYGAQESEKLNIIKENTINFLDVSEGFGIVIEDAQVSSDETSVSVTIKLTHIETQETKGATFIITGFFVPTMDSIIKAELDKFVNQTTKLAAPAQWVHDAINAATGDAKVTELAKYAIWAPLSTGFTMEITSVAIPQSSTNALEVTISVTQTEGGQTGNKTFIISGLDGSLMTDEIAKFNTIVSTTDSTKEALPFVTELNGAGIGNKLAILESHANLPAHSNGFEIEIGNANVLEDKTSVSVIINLSHIETEMIDEAIFTITDFAPTLDTELDKFVNQTTKLAAPAQWVHDAINAATGDAKVTELAKYAIWAPLSTGFTMEITSVAIPQSSTNALEVTISVTQTEGGQTGNKTFIISGLDGSLMRDEIARFENANSVSNDPTITQVDFIFNLNGFNPDLVTTEDAIAYLKSNTSYFPLPSDGFGIEYDRMTIKSPTYDTVEVLFDLTHIETGMKASITLDVTGLSPSPSSPFF